MANEFNPNIKPFNGYHLELWKSKITDHLKTKGLARFLLSPLENPPPANNAGNHLNNFNDRMDATVTILRNYVTDPIRIKILNYTTGFQIIQFLSDRFAEQSIINEMDVDDELSNLKLENFLSAEDFLNSFEELFLSYMSASGTELSDAKKVQKILRALPSEYVHFITEIKDSPTVSDYNLFSKALIRQFKLFNKFKPSINPSPPMASSSQHHTSPTRKLQPKYRQSPKFKNPYQKWNKFKNHKQSYTKNIPICYYCGLRGYIEATCCIKERALKLKKPN